MLSFEGVRFGFRSLAHDNYPEWEVSMRQLLSIQGIWEIVNGQVTKSELNHQGYELRDGLALALIRATIDLHVHPWVSGQFKSSKELWDSIECKLQRKKKQKTKTEKKKKEKKREFALTVGSEIPNFILPVPEIHDSPSDSSCLENLLEEAACMGNAQVFDQPDTITQRPLDLEAIQEFIPEQLELPYLDNKFDTIYNDTSCVVKELWDDIVENAEHDMGIQEKDDVEPRLDLSHLVVHSQFCEDSHQVLIQMLMDDADQHAGLHDTSNWRKETLTVLSHETAEELLDMEEQLIVEFPWLNLDAKTYDFAFIMSQVRTQQLEVPLHICLNIPFGCTHDGRVEHKTEYLASILYNDVNGSCNMLTVSSMCLHQANQVLLIINRSEDQFMDNHVLGGSQGSVRHVYELQSCTPDICGRDLGLQELLLGIATYKFSTVQKCDFWVLRELTLQAHFGNDMNVYFHMKREWYRGRKMWFKTMLCRPWLIWWLSLLYLMSTA